MARSITIHATNMMSRELLVKYKDVRDKYRFPLRIYIGVDLFHRENETMLEVITMFSKENEEYYNLAIQRSLELCQIQQNKLQYAQEL